MIISLADAQEIFPDVSQEDLTGLEIAIRKITNNPFQNRRVRFEQLHFDSEKSFLVFAEVEGLRGKDTIQISGSKWNDGLYVIDTIDNNKITVKDDARFFSGFNPQSFVTKVEYPDDIISGVRKLLSYDAKMRNKVGLKSKTVSRMSETYYDQNAGETVNGYPAAMMSFINKYRLVGW